MSTRSSPRLGRFQSAVYAAETRALDGRGLRWRRLRDAQRYVDALVGSEWFFERWPDLVRCTLEWRGSGAVWSCSVPLDAGASLGSPSEGVLLVAPGELDQPLVLHELAHLVAGAGAGHGPAFIGALLELVRHEMGFFAYADYREALRAEPAFAGHV